MWRERCHLSFSTHFLEFKGSCYPFTESSRTKMIIFEQLEDHSGTKNFEGNRKISFKMEGVEAKLDSKCQ